jgi:sulfur-carrier protein
MGPAFIFLACALGVVFLSTTPKTINTNPGEKRNMPTVFIPTPMRRLTGGQSKVTVAASNVDEAIRLLDQAYPGFAEKLLDGEGNPKRFINIFRNDDEIRTLQGLDTPVEEADRISIVPAMAGG